MIYKTRFVKLIITLLSFIAVFFIGIAISYLYLNILNYSKNNNEEPSLNSSNLTQEKINADSTINILLLGYGGAGHDGGSLTDSITLLNLNPQTQKNTLISIPRDLWVAIPTDWDNISYQKINTAYAIGQDDTRYANKKPEFRGRMGGGELVKYAVEQITGLHINVFIAVNFDEIKKIIDLLGGIEVNLSTSFDDYYYPIKGLENETCNFSPKEIVDFHAKYSGFELEKQFGCRYKHLHFEKGKLSLDSETALKFVRSRHSDTYGGDFARSERQQLLLLGIKEKILSLESFKKIGPLFDNLYNSVLTDIDLSDLKGNLNLIKNYSSFQTQHLYLTTKNYLVESKNQQGQYILIPKKGEGDWSEIQQYLKGGIYN